MRLRKTAPVRSASATSPAGRISVTCGTAASSSEQTQISRECPSIADMATPVIGWLFRGSRMVMPSARNSDSSAPPPRMTRPFSTPA